MPARNVPAEFGMCQYPPRATRTDPQTAPAVEPAWKSAPVAATEPAPAEPDTAESLLRLARLRRATPAATTTATRPSWWQRVLAAPRAHRRVDSDA